MLSLFLVSLQNPPSHSASSSFYEDASLPVTYSNFTALAFPYTGESSLHRTKGFSPNCCQTTPSSATYIAGAMGSSMCILWLVA